MYTERIILALGILLTGQWALAGEADVVAAEAKETGDGVWTISVTVAHEDAGWDHYANAWVVTDEAGNPLAERILHHPHDNEQPFTRSLSGVAIDPEVRQITIRAQDSVHGFGGGEFVLTLPGR